MWDNLEGVLPIIIICGTGIVACCTYIVCLLLFNRKKNKHKTKHKHIEVYELQCDDQDTFFIPIDRK